MFLFVLSAIQNSTESSCWYILYIVKLDYDVYLYTEEYPFGDSLCLCVFLGKEQIDDLGPSGFVFGVLNGVYLIQHKKLVRDVIGLRDFPSKGTNPSELQCKTFEKKYIQDLIETYKI